MNNNLFKSTKSNSNIDNLIAFQKEIVASTKDLSLKILQENIYSFAIEVDKNPTISKYQIYFQAKLFESTKKLYNEPLKIQIPILNHYASLAIFFDKVDRPYNKLIKPSEVKELLSRSRVDNELVYDICSNAFLLNYPKMHGAIIEGYPHLAELVYNQNKKFNEVKQFF